MSNNDQAFESYGQVKQRLDQIAQEVKSSDISLDDALALYEEAVKLGLQASNLIEDDTLGASEQDAPGETVETPAEA